MDKKTTGLYKRANSAQLTQTPLQFPNYNIDLLLLPISNDEPTKGFYGARTIININENQVQSFK